MAERRAHQPEQHSEHAKRDQRDDDVIGERVVEADRPDAAALQAAEAVFAAGHVAPAERDGVSERGERQRQQREVYAAAAQDDKTHQRRQDRDHDHRQQQRQPYLAAEPVAAESARRYIRRCRTRSRGRTIRGRCSRRRDSIPWPRSRAPPPAFRCSATDRAAAWRTAARSARRRRPATAGILR